MTFTSISDHDNIIDCNKWHFNRFLNPYLFDGNKWHFNRFLNACPSRFPVWIQSAISYKYQDPTPSFNIYSLSFITLANLFLSTIPPLPPLSRHCITDRRTSRSHCQSHNSQGYLPLDSTRSSPVPSSNLCIENPFFDQNPSLGLG